MSIESPNNKINFIDMIYVAIMLISNFDLFIDMIINEFIQNNYTIFFHLISGT